MKIKFYTYVVLLATAFAGIDPAMGQTPGTVMDSVFMGAGYSNEVYFSMSAGSQGTASRATWDIAFNPSGRSVSILTNDGSGVELYTYPNADTSGWATVSTTGIDTWKKMYNSLTDWETGAFCANQNPKGHPDYGWGVYNSVMHNIVGDSIFVIKLRDGSFRKIWIMEKTTANTYEFRYANIDGTGDTKVSLDGTLYLTKNFVGYSVSTNQVVDFEPVASTKWDILFTKYMGLSGTTPYPFTGVLINYGVKANKFKAVSLTYNGWADAPMNISRSFIGADWKKYNGATYDVADSLVYFVQDKGGNIYKLIFKDFVISTGRIRLEKGAISFTAVNGITKSGFNAAVYPNPVNDVMNLVINPGKSRFAVVSIVDMSGRTVLSKHYDVQSEDLSTLRIPVSELPSGLYMVKIQAGGNVITRKVIVNN